MQNDTYKTFKEHKKTLMEKPDIKPLEISDPRPAEAGKLYEVERSRRNPFPSQEGKCLFCGSYLDVTENRRYDSSVVKYCNKICRKDHEKQLIRDGLLVIINPNQTSTKLMVNTEDWVKGWWENIDKEPVYIRDKQHLIQECDKRGVMPKALLKPRSSGKGYEIRRN